MIFDRRNSSQCALLTLTLTFLCLTTASAAVRSDSLMSPNTRAFGSIADINTLQQHWQLTQLGQLVQDESMRPFVEDLKRQLERKISGVRDKLGLEIEDLQGVAGGEIGIGIVEQEKARAAVALTVDVTGNRPQLDALLVKIDKELIQRGAKKESVDANGTEMAVYTIPLKNDKKMTRSAIYFVKDNILCACDSRYEAQQMLSRFSGKLAGLESVKAYQETTSRCAKESNGLAPEIHWYVDPFGYASAIRSLGNPKEKRHGKDFLKIFSAQGFSAIQAIGGFVNLAVGGSYEVIHRTAVYAPAIPGLTSKYRLAMRMMKFPNGKSMATPNWLPRKLASYRTFNMDIENAFESFGSLFDAIAGYEDAFANVLQGLEKDPYGPRVDVKKDFIAHLGERITMVTDYQVPITTKCERFLFAVELTNEQAINVTIEKFMKSDPNAIQTEFEGRVVWEIQEELDDIPELDINISELDLLDEPAALPGGGNADIDRPTSAVCVTDGHLFIASHVSFLKEILSNKAAQDTLGAAGDYREVEVAMTQLLPGEAAARCFVRTDEAYRPTYELLRQGKMPESETLLGRLLNRLLSPPEDEGEGLLREQKIDGRKWSAATSAPPAPSSAATTTAGSSPARRSPSSPSKPAQPAALTMGVARCDSHSGTPLRVVSQCNFTTRRGVPLYNRWCIWSPDPAQFRSRHRDGRASPPPLGVLHNQRKRFFVAKVPDFCTATFRFIQQ